MCKNLNNPETIKALAKVKLEILSEVKANNAILLAPLSSNQQLTQAILLNGANELFSLKNKYLETSLIKEGMLEKIISKLNKE